MDEHLINELAEAMGIMPDFYDIWGNRHDITIETKTGVLRAMGLPVEDEDAMKVLLEKRLEPAVLEPSVAAEKNSAFKVYVCLPSCLGRIPIRIFLEDEKKDVRNWSVREAPEEVLEFRGRKYGKYPVEIGPLPQGYYTLSIHAPGRIRARSRLIVAPRTCYLPEEYMKSWGINLALHEIRSGGNWGIGDFRDLGFIMDVVAGLGGDFAGVLPLHQIPLPESVSPYWPLSRLYRNFIFLDLEGVPEFDAAGRGGLQKEIDALTGARHVDYGGVHALKLRILKEMFARFRNEHYPARTERGQAFEAFMEKEGGALLGYATFMALSEVHGTNWKNWPRELKDPRGGPVKDFRQQNIGAVLFHVYVQWLIDSQLENLSKRAARNGMRSGLYLDQAIGTVSGGADDWIYGECFAIGASAGAPPDEFNMKGQNWGFPPMAPHKMRESGFEAFIGTAGKNMEHAGMLRIDHALGLFRLFWIPEGMEPWQGAYVKYPAEEMMGILAIESRRHKTVIVAEDLGTVGPEVREALMSRNMLSYRLLIYERLYPSPDLVPPGQYPRMAFCAVSTHDLPTLYGWWAGHDMEVKHSLSLYPSRDSYREDLAARERDKAIILAALKKEGLMPDNYKMPANMNEELMLAIYRHLGRTPCLYVSVSLEDIFKSFEQPNLPGSCDDYPNWKMKTPMPIEAMAGPAASFAGVFRQEGRGR